MEPNPSKFIATHPIAPTAVCSGHRVPSPIAPTAVCSGHRVPSPSPRLFLHATYQVESTGTRQIQGNTLLTPFFVLCVGHG
jgi:hypothetical protein